MQITRRHTLALSAGLVLTACTPTRGAALATGLQSWVPDERRESMIQDAMQKHKVPGVGVAVIEDGEFSWQGNYGTSNIETGKPIDNQTLFQAASLTKPVFAYVVLRLIDAGIIGFEDRLVDTYRPDDLSDSRWNDQITVRHVLTHQTGLPNWRPADEETALLQPAFEPGTGYSYSGEAFHWLQQVCETKTGLGLNEIASQYLFVPAGLTDMSMLWQSDRDEREVYGHIVGEDGEAKKADLQFARVHGARLDEVAKRWSKPMTSWQTQDLVKAHSEMRSHTHPRIADYPLWRLTKPGVGRIIDSASSLRTTPADYARFIALIMHNTGPASISDDLMQDMLSIQTAVSDAGPNRPVGYSWSLEPRSGGVAFDHWGFNAGQHISSGLGDTSNGRGLVMMTNGSQGNIFMDEVGPVITGFGYESYVGV